MAAALDLVLRDGTVVTPAVEAVLDVGIADGRIVQVGGPMTAREEIDASDHYVLPGGIDANVHLTPPGIGPASSSGVDDVETGTRAAASGGITCIGNMSFPRNGEQMTDGLARNIADAGANAVVDWFQHPVLVTPDDAGVAQIEELAASGHSSVTIVLSSPGFDRDVDGYLRAMTAAADAGSVVLMHCEDQAIVHHSGNRLLDAGQTDVSFYPQARPVEAERVATERAVGYCAATGAATYVAHLSSRAALDACRNGRSRGLPIHVETRPIHLHLTEERFDEPDGAKYAGVPPLRSEADRQALWAGLADGSVATVSSHHAPQSLTDKLDPTLTAADLRHGLGELETMLPVLWNRGVATGMLSVARFVEVTSTAAARLFGLYPRKGTIAPGADADLVIWDPGATAVIDGSTMHSNAGYSTYDGWEITGWPAITISRGEIVARGRRVTGERGRGRQAPRSRFRRP